MKTKMTKKEFENTVGMKVSAEEYATIEAAYMNSKLGKSDFYYEWKSENKDRIKKYKVEQNEKRIRENKMAVAHQIYVLLQTKIMERGYSERVEDICNMYEKAALVKFNVWKMGDKRMTIDEAQSAMFNIYKSL